MAGSAQKTPTAPATPPPSWRHHGRCEAHEDLAETVNRVDERTKSILSGIEELRSSVTTLSSKVESQQVAQVARDLEMAKVTASHAGAWSSTARVVGLGIAGLMLVGSFLGAGVATVGVILKLME